MAPRAAGGVTALLAGCAAGSPAPSGTQRVGNLTGPRPTGRFQAGYTNLAIPAVCPDGSLLFVCGDTF